jgi:hypothetical protein
MLRTRPERAIEHRVQAVPDEDVHRDRYGDPLVAEVRDAVDNAGDAIGDRTKAQGADLGLQMVAGAGFEPATFGL